MLAINHEMLSGAYTTDNYMRLQEQLVFLSLPVYLTFRIEQSISRFTKTGPGKRSHRIQGWLSLYTMIYD